ncbi:hypothetical protein HZA38_05515, partial [Candidatus Peregrinibacteria bacterium]|nr:hypothetical protein [Candidatus Peregrinibacteria bacterium]
IVDRTMPGINGDVMIRTVVNEYKGNTRVTISALLVSGYSNEGKDDGIPFLAKPYRMSELRSAVMHALKEPLLQQGESRLPLERSNTAAVSSTATLRKTPIATVPWSEDGVTQALTTKEPGGGWDYLGQRLTNDAIQKMDALFYQTTQTAAKRSDLTINPNDPTSFPNSSTFVKRDAEGREIAAENQQIKAMSVVFEEFCNRCFQILNSGNEQVGTFSQEFSQMIQSIAQHLQTPRGTEGRQKGITGYIASFYQGGEGTTESIQSRREFLREFLEVIHALGQVFGDTHGGTDFFTNIIQGFEAELDLFDYKKAQFSS